MRRTVLGCFVGIGLSCLGCTEDRAPATAMTSTTTAGDSKEAERRALEQVALEPPRIAGVQATAVLEAQQEARALPKKADVWTRLAAAWIPYARVSRDDDDWLRAESAADVALHLAPAHVGAQNMRGLVLLHAHRFAEARDAAKQVLSRMPDDVMALGTLSDASVELGDVLAAEAAAERMMNNKPSLPAYTRVSWLRWLRGDVKAAVEAIRLAYDAGRGAPDREPATWALVQAADYFWFEGDLDGADAGYAMALEAMPRHPAALAGRARVALARGDIESAGKLATAAVDADATTEHAALLVDVKEAAGDDAGALAALARAKELGGRDRRALAQLLASRGEDLERALEAIEAELRTRGDMYTRDAHAFVLYRLGRYEDARAALEPLLALDVPDPRVMFHTGAVLWRGGDVERGRRLVERSLAKNPHFSRREAKEAREMLAASSTKTPSR